MSPNPIEIALFRMREDGLESVPNEELGGVVRKAEDVSQATPLLIEWLSSDDVARLEPAARVVCFANNRRLNLESALVEPLIQACQGSNASDLLFGALRSVLPLVSPECWREFGPALLSRASSYLGDPNQVDSVLEFMQAASKTGLSIRSAVPAVAQYLTFALGSPDLPLHYKDGEFEIPGDVADALPAIKTLREAAAQGQPLVEAKELLHDLCHHGFLGLYAAEALAHWYVASESWDDLMHLLNQGNSIARSAARNVASESLAVRTAEARRAKNVGLLKSLRSLRKRLDGV